MKKTENIVTYATEPHLELVGTNELAINGLKGIGEYTSERIRIDLGRYTVVINGCDLFINSFNRDGAIINGIIISLELVGND